MKKYETTKLFWGAYLYRLSISNQLSSSFRDKNLPFARQVLDTMQHEYEQGEPLLLQSGIRKKPVSKECFFDAKKLFNHFNKFDDYKLRIEYPNISIYTNNFEWLNAIMQDVKQSSIISLHTPDPNYINTLTEHNIIVGHDNGYQYKVTLGTAKGDVTFGQWAINNPKLIKVGPVLLQELLNSGYVNGMYFYARDERTLQLCNLMLSNIRRIDKLVVK